MIMVVKNSCRKAKTNSAAHLQTSSVCSCQPCTVSQFDWWALTRSTIVNTLNISSKHQHWYCRCAHAYISIYLSLLANVTLMEEVLQDSLQLQINTWVSIDHNVFPSAAVVLSIMVTVLCLGCTSNICGLDSLLVLLFLWDLLEKKKIYCIANLHSRILTTSYLLHTPGKI